MRPADLQKFETQLLHRLDVVSLPDALLKWGGGEADAPAEPQTLWHPQLVQFYDAPPVPAHLSAKGKMSPRISHSYKAVVSCEEISIVIVMCVHLCALFVFVCTRAQRQRLRGSRKEKR